MNVARRRVRLRATRQALHWLAFGACVLAVAGALGQPLAVSTATHTIELGGERVRVDVHHSPHIWPIGIAVVAHGFTRSRERHRDLGRALAEAGIVAVIPDLPNVVNLWGNGDAIVELVRKLEEGALGLPRVERARLVLIGTSAGGLATVLAGVRLPGVAGWIGLDPVDRTGTGVEAAAHFRSPAIVLLADPSGCNLFGSGRAIARVVPGLIRTNLMFGASHCDFESPTNNVCRAVCGASSSSMQRRIREETIDAVRELLATARHPELSPDRQPDHEHD